MIFLILLVAVTYLIDPTHEINASLCFFGVLAPVLGGLAGAGQFLGGKSRADKDRTLRADQMRYAPWTGRKDFQEVKDPSLFESLSNGIGAGAMLGKQFGAYSKPSGIGGLGDLQGATPLSEQIGSAKNLSVSSPTFGGGRRSGFSLLG